MDLAGIQAGVGDFGRLSVCDQCHVMYSCSLFFKFEGTINEPVNITDSLLQYYRNEYGWY